MLESFVEHAPTESMKTVRRVVCSGEALAPSLVNRFFERFDVELDNLYGPTEAAIDVTAWRCEPNETSVPIGRPIANTQTYVLDARLAPVPVGISGELYLGGVQLARGYHERPDLTAERFLPSPFATAERLYRTGDVARVRPDGAIVYLGRTDHQIKIRGFRIELGEIEARLRALDGVRDAIAIVREDTPANKRITGYVLPRDGVTLEPAALQDALRGSLPEYMIPSAFVVLDAFPQLPNGKVDRKALPAPEARPQAFTAPTSPLEESLAAMFAEVLRLERIGIHDDFFALGGHSLLATQVVSRVRAQFEVEIAVRTLFENRTVAELAGAIEDALLDQIELLGEDAAAPLKA
jgi:acyl-coenzyme A synthetase/AMP-(fatty) acid ligase/acyl carrier protein